MIYPLVARSSAAGRWRREPGDGHHFTLALAQQVGGIGRQGPEPSDPPRRPGHLDRVDPVGVAEAEVEPRVAGRLVAPPAEPPGDLAPTARDDGDPGADGVAVGGRPLEAEGQRSGPPAVLVVEVGQRLVLGERAAGRRGRRCRGRPRPGPGRPAGPARAARRGRSRRSVGPPRRRRRAGRHGVGDLRPVVVDVAVGRGQVEAAVVVDVEEGDAETEPVAGRHRQPDAAVWSPKTPPPRLR